MGGGGETCRKVSQRCSVLGADDGNIPHGVKHNCDADSLPAPASPDIRTPSQGQPLEVAARRLGYFAVFCFCLFLLTDRCGLCGCISVKSA